MYLYGSNYYRVNLTAHFVEVEFLDQHLPIPNHLPSGKGDAIDMALAMFIIGVFDSSEKWKGEDANAGIVTCAT